MNTTTLNTAHRHIGKPLPAPGPKATALRFAASVATLARRIAQWAMEPRVVRPDTAERLLALADAYQATQPSYAADLRAAALRTPGMHRYG